MAELCANVYNDLYPEGPTSQQFTPYDRGEARCVIAALTRKAVEDDGYSAYLGRTADDGDNSDNGHYILVTKGSVWKLYCMRSGWYPPEEGPPIWESPELET